MEAPGEARVHAVAILLRSWLRNRAERRLYRASPRDLPDLRRGDRMALSGISHASGGITSGDLVEGYLDADDVTAVVDDYPLSPVSDGRAANVVLHVTSRMLPTAVGGVVPLMVAVDLAEHLGPREESRAVAILREIGERDPERVTQWRTTSRGEERNQA